MTSISARLFEYLDHRRRFGADMTSAGLVLKPFAAFADAEGAEWITTELFLRRKDTFGSASQQFSIVQPFDFPVPLIMSCWIRPVSRRAEPRELPSLPGWCAGWDCLRR